MTASRRLGAGAGFAGDRLDPAVDLVQRGALDALVFECLAERTITLAHQARAEGRGPGYDGLLRERLAATLPAARRHGTLVVTNSGAADPRGAAQMVRDLAVELTLSDTVVASVEGDDVLDRLSLPDSPVLGSRSGATLADYAGRIVGANAYLGVRGICDALAAGAHVVITGRTSDAALFLGPLLHWFGWADDDLDRVADGTLVGHLLECAGQLTGGYFADGSPDDVPGLARLGFPMADVTADGSAEFSKLPGTGGRLDRATTLEQLLYEVGDPAAYLTPDVTLDVTGVQITETGPDRVRVHGARGTAAPDTLKVSVGVRDGWQGVGEISYAGPHALARGRLAAQVVTERWSDVHGLDDVPLRADLVGIDSCRPWAQLPAAEPPEVRVRLAVRSPEERPAVLLAREVEALYTNGPAGGGGVVTSVRPTLGLVSTTIDRREVEPVVTVFS